MNKFDLLGIINNFIGEITLPQDETSKQSKTLTKVDIRNMMKYNIKEFYNDPHNFDCPPPKFESTHEKGWLGIAKAIVVDDKR